MKMGTGSFSKPGPIPGTRCRRTHLREAQYWKGVLEKILHQTKWSQRELAKRAGITPATGSKIMNSDSGKVQTRTAAQLEKLADGVLGALQRPQDAPEEKVQSGGAHKTPSKQAGDARAMFEVEGPSHAS